MKVVTHQEFQKVFDLPGCTGYGLMFDVPDIQKRGCAVCKVDTLTGKNTYSSALTNQNEQTKNLCRIGWEHDSELAAIGIDKPNLTLAEDGKTWIQDDNLITWESNPTARLIHEKYVKLAFQEAIRVGLIQIDDTLSHEFTAYNDGYSAVREIFTTELHNLANAIEAL